MSTCVLGLYLRCWSDLFLLLAGFVMITRTQNKCWFFCNIMDGSSAVQTGTIPLKSSEPNYAYSGSGPVTKISF